MAIKTEAGAKGATKQAEKLAKQAAAFWAAAARTTIEGGGKNGWRIRRARPDGGPLTIATLPSRALATTVKAAFLKAEQKHGRETSAAYEATRAALRALAMRQPKKYSANLDEVI